MTRGRITESSDLNSPDQGKDPRRSWSTVRAVTFAHAVAPVRLVATAFAVASLLAFLVVGRADGASRSWSVYLAPESACRSATDANAPAAVQTRAIACMLNWARAQDRRSRLVRRPALQRAAAMKGERVASCGQFSHTPCGSAVTAAVRASGYRYAAFGENLFAVGTGLRAPGRDGVAPVAAAPRERAQLAFSRCRRSAGAGARTARRR